MTVVETEGFGPVALGKEPVKEDERNLQFAAYVEEPKLLPVTPTHCRWSRPVKSVGFPMYQNDSLPDCTCAALAHGEMVFSHNSGIPEVPLEAEVLEMFDATGPRNRGRYMLDILNRWRNVGFGVAREQIHAYVQVDLANRPQVEAALWLFGGLYVGIDLPVSAQGQKRWTVGRGAPGERGSWGGHAVWVPDFTKQRGLTAVTWGRLQPMSWGFLRAYADEAYAVLSPDWASGERKSPSGFDLEKLQADLASI